MKERLHRPEVSMCPISTVRHALHLLFCCWCISYFCFSGHHVALKNGLKVLSIHFYILSFWNLQVEYFRRKMVKKKKGKIYAPDWVQQDALLLEFVPLSLLLLTLRSVFSFTHIVLWCQTTPV